MHEQPKAVENGVRLRKTCMYFHVPQEALKSSICRRPITTCCCRADFRWWDD